MDSHLIKIIICALLAIIPVIMWGYIFLKRSGEPAGTVILTFIAGMVSVAPIILYKLSWQYFPELNLFNYFDGYGNNVFGFTGLLYLPLSTLLSFFLVGMIEEYMKHLAVKTVDNDRFKSIDDAIEYSIVAALGFSFIENTMYFFYIWHYQGIDTLYLSFVFRSVFSTFAHILFSGIYGYYYGLAYFAEPVYQEELKNQRHPIIKLLHSILNLRSSTIFAREKMTQGLFYAIVLHAFFNVMLEMDLTFLMIPFLIFGYSALTYLIAQKRNHVKYGRIRSGVRASFASIRGTE